MPQKEEKKEEKEEVEKLTLKDLEKKEPEESKPRKELEEVIEIKDIRGLFKPHPAVPAHTPKSFEEQFYLYKSGTTRILYVWIDGAWKALTTIDVSLFIRKDGSIAFTGNQSMGGKKLTNLPAPVADNDAARKKYVDDKVGLPTNTKEYEAGENLAIRNLCSRGHEITINGETVLRDSYVSEITGEQDTNFGNQNIMRVEQDAISHFTKGIIWFDISALPDGDDVDSVKLKFYVSAVSNLGGENYVVIGSKRVTATWAEDTITWNNKPGEGGAYGSSANINATGWYEVDITNLYKEWKAGTYTNYGVWLYGLSWSVADLPAYADITSKEGSASYRPYLYITYWGDKTKVYKAKATNWMGTHLAGFNTSNKTTGQTAVIQSSGSLDGFSLTEGSDYYASNTPGAISTSKGTVDKLIGRALTSSVLNILLTEPDIGRYKLTASDVLRESADTPEGVTGYNYSLKKEIIVNGTGIIRVKFDLKRTSPSGFSCYGKIYINGIAKGIEREGNEADYKTFTEDIKINVGDYVQIYCKVAAETGYVRNFRIYFNTSSMGITEVTNP